MLIWLIDKIDWTMLWYMGWLIDWWIDRLTTFGILCLWVYVSVCVLKDKWQRSDPLYRIIHGGFKPHNSFLLLVSLIYYCCFFVVLSFMNHCVIIVMFLSTQIFFLLCPLYFHITHLQFIIYKQHEIHYICLTTYNYDEATKH